MITFPRYATTYSLFVPDEESAREGARVLTGRGHAIVRVAPDTTTDSGWRIDGLDEGPYPDGDDRWWAAAEHRAVAALAEELGGRLSTSMALPETARRFFPEGEGVRDPGTVRELRLGVLSREPARTPAPAVVHGLGRREPSGGPTGGPIVLDGLDDVDWASLTGAYGPADEVPDILRGLAANDEEWEGAVEEYFSTVVHQDTCYDCTPETIRFLVQLVRSPRLFPAYRLELLIHMAYVATIDPVPATGEADSDEAAACRAVVDHLPDLLALWPEASAAVRAWLIVLAAVRPGAQPRPEFEEFRRRLDGPSPALDLALALTSGDGGAVRDLTLAAASWDEEVSAMLEEPFTRRTRELKILFHLALTELAPSD
ncbi:hypothetical protein BKA00_006721 [Actinomadura coerulea]|uniref:Uncharacterized protein n=1 Tax=Actinomadura coerulea TaxID=46159 RepID=A0A7X0G5K8_9ACTN|nr:hypothetical protein [Actinomadura coerulea]MBB6399807.1 hypothetical protein [Actinomadura coerulea]GGQ16127.1 hypothetical protein GCM10010187_35420 [Actinomadura coerulea]